MQTGFTHLHTHSHYSLLAALPKIDELIETAKKNGMTALALTDNGNMYGAIEFYKACKKAGLKPIIGVDAYVAARTRKDKQAGVDNRRTRLILLAKNLAGYKNLIKLVTDAHLEGFYYKPRVDAELLEKYAEGLLAISPAWNSQISEALKNGDQEKARTLDQWYKKTFGAENFFLEITHHPDIDGHEKSMEMIKKFGKETETPIMAAQDIYYLAPEDKKARDTLMLVNSNAELSERSNGSESAGDFSFISETQAKKYFKNEPEALQNTIKIADMCNLEIELGKWVFPDFPVASGKTLDEELKKNVYDGIKSRNLPETPELIERVEYELKVIRDKGYAPYFLVVSDLLRHAREAKILSTTRGSAAGSMVSFLTYITTVNPIEYKLPFNRFLNPERPSAPDIDMDIADNRRDEMIAYARQKYGADKVAQIGTFGTMMARGSVRDVTRALGHPYSLGDRLSKLIPMGSQGFPMSIDRAIEMVPELKKAYKEETEAKEIIDLAKKIEGCARHISVHAAGVVIAPSPLIDFTPLQFDPKGEGKIITQYDMYVMEDVGLLKLDFLGIKNLSILADAVSLAKKLEGKEVDIENVPVDDKKTFEMLAAGITGGLFQLNGSGMTRYLKELRPSSIHDINAMVALYRPGPMESIPEYIARKHNPTLVKFLDPRMKNILSESYGVMTYQDDVMLVAIELAGYSWLEADKLRKAMGKKIPAEMEAQKDKLIKGLIKNGMTDKKADELWKLIEPFAAYGFNKCLTGDTEIVDTKTGLIQTIKKIWDEKCLPNALSMNAKLSLVSQKTAAIVQNGEKEVFELTTRSGRKIKATGNHPFYTMHGWTKLENISTGAKIAVTRSLEKTVGKKSEKERAVVLGYLLSEGNLCHPHGIYFYSTQDDEIKDFVKACKIFSNFTFKINSSKSAKSVYCGQIDPKKGNTLNKWIESLGLKNKKATEKFVPENIFQWNAKSLSILLGKMWQGDGCVSIKNEQTYYATSSEKMAGQVQHLLLRLGIISTIHAKQFKYRGAFKAGWTIVISHRENLGKFKTSAGKYLIGKKKKELEKLCEKSSRVSSHAARGTTDTVPAEIILRIKEIMAEKGISPKELSKMTSLAPRLFFADKKKIGYQREVIKIIGTALGSEEIMNYGNSDIFWDEVRTVKKIGVEMTYDMEMPEFHNFVANDIIVHNSHAASYGKVAYQTAYMKANFPAIYMSAVLTADSGDVEKIAEIIAECKRMGIPVLPPSINESFSNFTVVKPEESRITNQESRMETEKDRIRFGLTTIKNFGEGIADIIISERKVRGKFKSLGDFLNRIRDRNLNKKSLEALIKAGAMDEFGERGIMLANMENLLAYNKEKANMADNQDSLFGGLANSSDSGADDFKLSPAPVATQAEKLAWEKELLGLYISGHPLDKFKSVLEKREITIAKTKTEFQEGMIVVIGGIIEEAKPILTKKNDQMMFVRLADMTGTIEVVVFPRVFEEFKKFLVAEKCVAIKGKISNRNDEISLIAEKIKELA